ncbi:MAG: flavodoxin, partial [Clostridium sp.]|nr:flavodoxin [Clostridium sp.]
MIFGLAACGSSTAEAANTTEVSTTTEVSDTAAEETQTESAENAAAAEPETDSAENAAAEETQAEAANTAEASAEHSDVLVAYFSATGTTKGVAEKIASVTGGDLYQILAAQPYSDADLNYNDSSSRTTKEQNDKSARPEIGSEEISLDGYTTVYLGFPIWWGEEPRILDTFVEKYSFEGITVIPFCTSG